MTPFAFWIFATWCTLIDLLYCFTFCDFHQTHSGPCCEVPDGQGLCSSSEMQAKGEKVEESTSEVLRYETKVLQLRYLWPCNINHRNNNTSNNGDILKHWGHLRAIASCSNMSWCHCTSSNSCRRHLSNRDPNCGHQLGPKLKTL